MQLILVGCAERYVNDIKRRVFRGVPFECPDNIGRSLMQHGEYRENKKEEIKSGKIRTEGRTNKIINANN
jgi:hypothetical protein